MIDDDPPSGQLDALIDRVRRDHPETWGYGRRGVRGDPCGDPPLRPARRLRIYAMRTPR